MFRSRQPAAKTPRKVASARRRAAHYADLERRAADDPRGRFDAAMRMLMSALKHASSEKKANERARELRENAAAYMEKQFDRAGMGDKSIAHYRDKLAQPGTDRQRLGRALSCLGGVIAGLSDSDRLYTHYAGEMAREAREVEGWRKLPR